MTSQVISHWFKNTTQQDLVLGYGSLMSADSRTRFSSITGPALPVTVSGYYRAWVTRSPTEQQTYVGALPEQNAQLNAQLIPATIDPKLQDREKDYQFVLVNPQNITSRLSEDDHDALVNWLEGRKVWLCQTLDAREADDIHPVSQTYIDTCLAGCLEHGGDVEAQQFLNTTRGWQHPRINDRANPRYPRAAKVESDMLSVIDAMLENYESTNNK